jgi:hypothetical protein
LLFSLKGNKKRNFTDSEFTVAGRETFPNSRFPMTSKSGKNRETRSQ